ncbi:uncharacterized protein EDB93DRAFT_1100699 [Suillus bovinus]|uniref:uncharacterized protein n=1 Tax=Suillus bovinus TaxID=48563 RepID=UPI001B876199|nr:uncharacterized protein EDB93DRAFT_1100699 [Suillus bovinus]KAG2157886.1 hypothetical protein EDB93DRAFT_1100699 [Suillus bovinus]
MLSLARQGNVDNIPVWHAMFWPVGLVTLVYTGGVTAFYRADFSASQPPHIAARASAEVSVSKTDILFSNFSQTESLLFDTMDRIPGRPTLFIRGERRFTANQRPFQLLEV